MSDRHQTKPYPLRMSDELRRRLDHEGALNRRSLNAEIVARLEASFPTHEAGDNSTEAKLARLKQMHEQVSDLIKSLNPDEVIRVGLAEDKKRRQLEEAHEVRVKAAAPKMLFFAKEKPEPRGK